MTWDDTRAIAEMRAHTRELREHERVVDLAAFPENPADMYTRAYYVTCIIVYPGAHVDESTRVDHGTDYVAARARAERLAEKHGLRIEDATGGPGRREYPHSVPPTKRQVLARERARRRR